MMDEEEAMAAEQRQEPPGEPSHGALPASGSALQIRDLASWLREAAGSDSEGAEGAEGDDEFGEQHARGAVRHLLRSHPAWPKFLSAEPALVQLAERIARRLRHLPIMDQGATEGSSVHNPRLRTLWIVCECVWHTMGLLVRAQQSKAVPGSEEEDALQKQISTLSHTTAELRLRLSECRRAYLLELTELRAKCRRLDGADAADIEEVTRGEPVMFFEPLDYLLDGPTKAFVHAAVEERLKLLCLKGCRREREGQVPNQDVTQRLADLEREIRSERGRASRAEERVRALEDALEDERATQKASTAHYEEQLGSIRPELTQLRHQETLHQRRAAEAKLELEAALQRAELAYREMDGLKRENSELRRRNAELLQDSKGQAMLVAALRRSLAGPGRDGGTRPAAEPRRPQEHGPAGDPEEGAAPAPAAGGAAQELVMPPLPTGPSRWFRGAFSGAPLVDAASSVVLAAECPIGSRCHHEPPAHCAEPPPGWPSLPALSVSGRHCESVPTLPQPQAQRHYSSSQTDSARTCWSELAAGETPPGTGGAARGAERASRSLGGTPQRDGEGSERREASARFWRSRPPTAGLPLRAPSQTSLQGPARAAGRAMVSRSGTAAPLLPKKGSSARRSWGGC